MEVIDHLEACPRPPEGCIVTVGNFDGVHKGHAAVIRALQASAAERGASTAVVTFEPHTLETIRPDRAPQRLTSADRKLELLRELGLDYALVLTFDRERAQQSAEEFVEEILAGCLHAKTVMVGEDFRFGQGARGDIDLLRKLGAAAGFDVEPIQIVRGEVGLYSSTGVRQAISAGRLDVAEAMLGRPYDVRGNVVPGDRRGQVLGFPTANVDPGSQVALPPLGVYAGRVRVSGEDVWRDAIVNFGVRPTVRQEADDPRPLLEAHIFDFEGDLYGRMLDVAFIRRLRDERKFESLDALRRQIGEDVQVVRELLGTSADLGPTGSD